MKMLSESNLSEPDRAAATAAASLLRRSFPWVSRVVVFGSRARGDADVDSDMDLLVLTTGTITQDQRHAITGVLSPLGRELDVMFSTIVVPEAEWQEGIYRVLPIHAEVARDGVAA